MPKGNDAWLDDICCVCFGPVTLHGEGAGWGQRAAAIIELGPAGTARLFQLRPIACRRVYAHQGLAENRSGGCSSVPPRRQRVRHESSFQEALHAVRQGRVHGGHRSPMDYAREASKTGVGFALDFMFWLPRIERSAGSSSLSSVALSAAGTIIAQHRSRIFDSDRVIQATFIRAAPPDDRATLSCAKAQPSRLASRPFGCRSLPRSLT